MTLAILLAGPVSGATTNTVTVSASSSGTIASGTNCGASCSALGVCTSSTTASAVLMRWNLASFSSANASISAASLTLPVSINGVGVPTMSVYGVSANWVTPTGSNTNPCVGGTPGTGQPTIDLQATPSTAWTATAGVNGSLLLSLTPLNNQVGDAFATSRSSAALLALVQFWVANPSSNFGLVVVGPNSTTTSSVFLGTPTLTITSDQLVPVATPTKSVTYTPPTYTTGTRTPNGVLIPTRYTSTTSGAIVGGVIGGLAAVILIIAVATAFLRGGSSTSYRSRRVYRY